MDFIANLFGVSTAYATSAGTTTATGEADTLTMLLTTILPMVLIFVVFYFLLIRPQRKKDKQVKEMLNNLKVGDRICTIGGIYGTITGLKDDTVELAVGRTDVPVVFARWAIRSVEEIAVENDAEQLN